MVPHDLFRPELAEEFRRDPLGVHGSELQRLLDFLRGEPLEGKYVLVESIPHREWFLGQLSGQRGEPVRVQTQKRFSSLADAEWEVFKLRWEKWTGEAPR